MDFTAVLSVGGALVGVVVGSWLAGRQQAGLQLHAQRQSELAVRRAAYVEFLSTMRRFRRFVITAPVVVTLWEGANSPRGKVPIIEGADTHWDAVEHARSQLWIVTGHDSAVSLAGERVVDAFFDVARARASHAAGDVPAAIIDPSRNAEREFARLAQIDLREALS